MPFGLNRDHRGKRWRHEPFCSLTSMRTALAKRTSSRSLSSIPVDMTDGLLLYLFDLLVQGVFSHCLQRASYPRRAPPLLSIPRKEEVKEIKQIDTAISVCVEPARGQASSTEQIRCLRGKLNKLTIDRRCFVRPRIGTKPLECSNVGIRYALLPAQCTEGSGLFLRRTLLISAN